MDIKPTVHNARKEGGTLVCFLKIKRNPQHHHKQDSNVICKDYTTMENTTQNFCPLTFYELCPTQGEIASKRNLRNRKWLYIWSTLHVYTMASAKNQTAAHHNLICRSMTAPPPVLWPSSIQPLHYHFHEGWFRACFQSFHYYNFLFFKLPNLKFPKSGTLFIRLFVVFFQVNN